MFIATNRFQIVPDREEAVERVWTSLDAWLDGVPRFGGFEAVHIVMPS